MVSSDFQPRTVFASVVSAYADMISPARLSAKVKFNLIQVTSLKVFTTSNTEEPFPVSIL